MAKDSISKEEEKQRKKLAKEEKMKKKIIEKEEKRGSKEEKKRSKEEQRRSKEERKKTKSQTDVHVNVSKINKPPEKDVNNKMETQSVKSDTKSVRSANKTNGESFKFQESRFVMPRGRKGYIFPVTPGPARYPITRVNYPIMKARRQVDLTKKMIAGPSTPAYTMGIRHSDLREFYNKIQ